MHSTTSLVLAAIRRLQRQQHLVNPGDTLVVAVSGGQDSLCLLHSMALLRGRLGINLHVAHVDHMLRGAASEADAEFVRSTAEGLGLPCTVVKGDVPRYRRQHRLSEEVAARYVRYQLLARIVVQVGGTAVALAHTADDSVETVLINFIRGTGPRGLAGMAPIQVLETHRLGPLYPPPSPQLAMLPGQVRLIRPLLRLARTTTAAYCAENGLVPRTDVSNLSIAYLRNRVRLHLLPVLETYNPGFRGTILRVSEVFRDEAEIVETSVRQVLPSVVREEDGTVVFSLASWQRLATGLQRHLLRWAVERLTGSVEALVVGQVEEMRRFLAEAPPFRQMGLRGNLCLTKEPKSFRLSVQVARPTPPRLPGEIAVQVPGRTRLDGLGWVQAEVLSGPEALDTARASFTRKEPFEAWLDADKVSFPLHARTRRPGDRFIPLGLGKPKKLQDFMVDERVPEFERDSIPLIVSPGGIVWVVGLRIDDRFKVDQNSRRLMHLTFFPSQAEAALVTYRRRTTSIQSTHGDGRGAVQEV